jgi:leucyl-tRNA synthetase
MSAYNPQEIEKKWQKIWEEKKLHETSEESSKPKFYALDMFPYISGSGIHIGHPKGYTATDVVSRFKMLQGFNVLHPMGWDAFGLPAENYAIKNKINPNVFVKEHINRFRNQLKMFGFTYDWEREFSTTDPEYYKWTQWIFLKLFEKGLAFESNEPVNWCPKCKTVLANEDLEKGLCERCGTEVIQKKLRQWVLKMTDYADRLLYDLDSEDLDWEDLIKEQQRNWIGRSEGAEFEMKVKNTDEKIEVYTTRIDTVFGMTYAVVAPEHPIIEKLKDKIENYSEVEEYVVKAQNKTELERTQLQKEKTGVEIEGIKIINPFAKEEIPLFVADYVLGFYGTGAVMAVPAHDERDWEFAKKYDLAIKEVIKDTNNKSSINKEAFIDDGVLINSEKYNGFTSEEAREKMTKWLEENKIGKGKINYKMRDWVFSRQRYWGEPIPIIHCEKCGVVTVPEKDLPVTLPNVENYEPTDTGESPLANVKEWVNVKCPKCQGDAKRETNTMPQWAGSCWYYLRYIDPKNDEALVDKNKEKYWMPVDLYVGGAEHATRHLLYARFWHKFLFDIGVVSGEEPFKKLVHVGLINAEDGRKMSKRWGNVVNPEDVISQFGVDSMRLYEMFMGPFSQAISWSTKGVSGMRRFLERFYKLGSKISEKEETDSNLENLLHKTIKKVGEDIENFRFNTAISSLMILTNELDKQEKIYEIQYTKYLILLAPFAPHIAEELWEKLGHKESIFKEKWPEYDPEMIKDEEIKLVIQINGKLRDRIKVPAEISEDEAKKLAMESEKIKSYILGKNIKKIIFVKGKLINIVI